jgi:hypothetical protein
MWDTFNPAMGGTLSIQKMNFFILKKNAIHDFIPYSRLVILNSSSLARNTL